MSATAALVSAAVLFTIEPAIAQPRPDFSGRWSLQSVDVQGGRRGDPATRQPNGPGGGAGGGTGLGAPPARLVIQQDPAALTIEEHRDGGDPVTIVIPVDGAKRSNPIAFGRGRSGKAEYKAKWEGATLHVTIVAAIEARGGTASVEFREKRWLAADGTLIVETHGRAGSGRKAVYRRDEEARR